MDKHLGTLLSSDPGLFSLHKPAKLLATQSTPNGLTSLVNTFYPKLRKKSDTQNLNLHQSLTVQLPVSSAIIFPRAPSPLFSHLHSGITPAKMPFSTPSQKSQPEISTFKLQTPLETNQNKPPPIVHKNPITHKILIAQFRPSVPTFLSTHITQPMPIFSLPSPPETIPMNSPAQHLTIPTTNTLPSSVITSVLEHPTSQGHFFNQLLIQVHSICQRVLHFCVNYKHLLVLIIDTVVKYF